MFSLIKTRLFFLRICDCHSLPPSRILTRSSIKLNPGRKKSISSNLSPSSKHDFSSSTSSVSSSESNPNPSSPSTPDVQAETVNVIYITKDGQHIPIGGKEGDNAMYLAHANGVEIEGACEASLACCTCHVYVDYKFKDKLPSPKEEEDDMLDMAPFLKENSRLSCQIILTKELDGIQLTLPPATRNFYVDGHKPQPH